MSAQETAVAAMVAHLEAAGHTDVLTEEQDDGTVKVYRPGSRTYVVIDTDGKHRTYTTMPGWPHRKRSPFV